MYGVGGSVTARGQEVKGQGLSQVGRDQSDQLTDKSIESYGMHIDVAIWTPYMSQ